MPFPFFRKTTEPPKERIQIEVDLTEESQHHYQSRDRNSQATSEPGFFRRSLEGFRSSIDPSRNRASIEAEKIQQELLTGRASFDVTQAHVAARPTQSTGHTRDNSTVPRFSRDSITAATRSSVEGTASRHGGSLELIYNATHGYAGHKADTAVYKQKRKEEIAEEKKKVAETVAGVIGVDAKTLEHANDITGRAKIKGAILGILLIGIIFAIILLGKKVHDDHGSDPQLHSTEKYHPYVHPLDMSKPRNWVEFSMSTTTDSAHRNNGSDHDDKNFTLTLGCQPAFQNDTNSHIWYPFGEAYTQIQSDAIKGIFAIRHDFNNKFEGIENAVAYGIIAQTNSEDPIGVAIVVHQLGLIGEWQVLIAALILIIVLVLIALDIVHRTLIALLGMFFVIFWLAILGKAPTVQDVVVWIEEGTIILLLGMMIIVHVLSTTGVFEWTAVRAFQISKGNLKVLYFVLTILTAVLSALLDNVSTILLLVPVTIKICEVMDVSPTALIISEAMFSNIGGAATLIGDPPNIIIGNSIDSIGFIEFLVNMLPGVLFVAPFVLATLYFLFRKQLDYVCDPSVMENIQDLKDRYPVTNPKLLLYTGMITIVTILMFFLEPLHHVQASWIALFGATLAMLASTPHELQHTLEAVEWDLLIFFSALFIMVEGLAEMNLIRWIGDRLADLIASVPEGSRLTVAIVILIWVSGVVSAFLDNIPYTATMVPVIVQLGENPELGLDIQILAWALAFGADFGGNGTIIGASGNLVMAGLAGREGIEISFISWMKYGPLVCFVSLTFGMTYMLIRYVAAA